MKKDERTSSVERLMALPAVFSLADLQVEQDLDAGLARLYAVRWVERGLAKRFGAGVYFNLLADRDGPSRRLPEALGKLLRVPVVITGGHALTAAGWTTQVHRRIEIAVPVMRGSITVPATEGDVVLSPRYLGWFRKLSGSSEGAEADGIPVASPDYALADALLAPLRSVSSARATGAPPPDEIDMGGFDADALDRVREAMRDLGATAAEVEEATAGYEAAVGEPRRSVSY